MASLSSLFYLSLESGFLALDNEEDELGIPAGESVSFSGSMPELGEFNLRIEEPKTNTYNLDGEAYDNFADTVGRTSFFGAQIPIGAGWKAKSEYIEGIYEGSQTSSLTIFSPSHFQRSFKPS